MCAWSMQSIVYFKRTYHVMTSRPGIFAFTMTRHHKFLIVIIVNADFSLKLALFQLACVLLFSYSFVQYQLS